ncbi:MAG: riboflavin synthase [Planctomycetes bacterium]|nr:riboflavin synthase [Planctomycetota bacterium]
MFTGIVEHVGSIASLDHGPGGTRLAIDLGPLAEGSRLGDSICVSGACLTIDRLTGTLAEFDCSPETRRKTTVAGWKAGRRVNLERALRVGDRLGGHLVSGHVDGVGRVVERRREGEGERLTIVLPDGGAVRVVEKGSLAIDGISLTTWDCRGSRCSIAVIPHTLSRTTLGDLRAGDPVNLETDPIGRWVESLLRR